jgi:hypothetical protein
VHFVQGVGLERRWLAVSRENVSGSVTKPENRWAAASMQCTRGLGKGGVVLAAQCRAGVHERRRRRGPGCTGT